MSVTEGPECVTRERCVRGGRDDDRVAECVQVGTVGRGSRAGGPFLGVITVTRNLTMVVRGQ
jgi:hypothetical protein